MDIGTSLALLLGTAWLAPLLSFVLIVLLGNTMGKGGKYAAYLATVVIVGGCLLSLCALFFVWLPNHPLHAEAAHPEVTEHLDGGGEQAPDGAEPAPSAFPPDTTDQSSADQNSAANDHEGAGDHGGASDHDAAGDHAGQDHSARQDHSAAHAHAVQKPYYSGDIYTLARFGPLDISISYYIDTLTVAMFCMVTLIASCIHFYAIGYMHEELDDEVVDHEVTMTDGRHLHRPGRFHRFFQYLSLFCFSMLGLVLAGNIFMVFVFWELVGICSYFLIGFYVERKSASNAANKAFIVNRVGDFGMIIGLMIVWGTLGTFAFGDQFDQEGHLVEQGIFSKVRPGRLHGEENRHQLKTPPGMVLAGAGEQVQAIRAQYGEDSQAAEQAIDQLVRERRNQGHGYWLLVIAGLGIFCGCVGKSAQFPLHVWLPDAMEGPTPVSALVHSATMVAAGVYLVGRFYPVFAPEVLLTIAYIGAITLFLAATIAITAVDIKRVLAYSTISQLGYMMLALGIGGWVAGLLHLFTHAFFKSLLFMCSGSVIHAVHTNDMREMGGLLKKMPYTAWTMLVGCLAIIGAGIPFVIGFSGYYSKDAIIEQALLFTRGIGATEHGIGATEHGIAVPGNPIHSILFVAAAGGAAITAFYMFRLWYMTFIGEPRDKHRFDHAHESPKVMYVPLVILAVFATGVAWPIPFTEPALNPLKDLIEQARPAGTLPVTSSGLYAYDQTGMLIHNLVYPHEHLGHEDQIVRAATLIAFGTALAGFLLATVIYAWRLLDPNEIRNQFRGVHRFLVNKWWFDEFYEATFFRFTHVLAKLAAWIDRHVLDGFVHGCAWAVRGFSRWWEKWADRRVVDGSINWLASRTWRTGVALHGAQTGNLRQYVMFIVLATIVLYFLITFAWQYAVAG